ncbi:DeoR/GlpR transcriptional regulator [Pseudoflavonifractor sp. 524-17]|uniref:DeoR/GlpR family DNA-binding transcription regulator n=1 Tax=Pseudoflavonifractor sp. 524-17 TaxID=2304577 RepID=UPI00137B5174|nr:DeoR/GlpR family DNA-binding transcription regulator [Pseudoflavonifractor sp. 524-17]NCE66151.1 DeoR/GlpR transcriptional regulator [Pseudoflavonifractor sp. 524-17]
MLAEVRMEAILAELDKEQAVSVAHLCRVTGASEATIRRDLNELARRGKLNKVHGGALPVREEFQAEEPDMDTKRKLHTPEKMRIARYAAGLITDDDVVYLDAGSTVMYMTDHIRATKATFVTNSVECIQRLPRRGLRTYVLGGVLKPGTLTIIGGEAVERLKKYNFTKAFLGVNGIAVSPGFTTPDPEEAMVKATAAAHARQTWVLADSSKFGAITAATFLPLDGGQIITDRLDDRRYREFTDIKEV